MSWLPITAAYSTGLVVALACLVAGAYALVANGVAHNMSFSSIMRTTRNTELNELMPHDDISALPLHDRVKTQKLRFYDDNKSLAGDDSTMGVRHGFILNN